MSRFADILLPVALSRPFTYRIPEGMELAEGMLAEVPFGRSSKAVQGIVWRLHNEKPARGTVKAIVRIFGPIAFTEKQRALLQWVADYYMCPLGEVFRATTPARIRSGEYRPSTELFVRLAPDYRTPEAINRLFGEIKRARVQCRAIEAYLSLLPEIDPETDSENIPRKHQETPPANTPETTSESDEPLPEHTPVFGGDQGWVERSLLTGETLGGSAIPPAILLQLIKRGVLEQTERFPGFEANTIRSAVPSDGDGETQALAQELTDAFAANVQPDTLLLWGDTSGIFTRLYSALATSESGQTLLLLPDNALTPQILETLERIAGNTIVFYHPRLTDRARCAAWHRLGTSPESARLVVGSRAALFLPFGNLRQIIIHNEHDTSFHQRDNSPRFHARDTALVLARLHGARTLLASPAPSTESYLNAIIGKYGLLKPSLQENIPQVKLLERGQGLISKYLHRRIDETLAEGRQVVLFQNRRGFSPYVECPECGHTPSCDQCNVTLTYHKESNSLLCHYCGCSHPFPPLCPECGKSALQPRGIGTERIEEQIAALFPEARVARLDTDSASGMRALGRIMGGFAVRQTDILVGTQMVTRTAQIGDVELVGVINADNMLAHTDFRASERAFQMLVQLGTLAGKGGEIVIQCSQRKNPALAALESGDHDAFYRSELQTREALNYPPYTRLIQIEIRHGAPQVAERVAGEAFRRLRERFGPRISPPFEPQIDRIQGMYILQLLLRIERSRPVSRAKAIVMQELDRLRQEFPTASLTATADPI